jgi:hypothetical protein
MTCPDCEGKIVTIQEGRFFDVKDRFTDRPLIMRMDKQNTTISFDHLHSFLIDRISEVAFHIFLKRIFASPSTFQDCPDVKKDLLWRDNRRVDHMELFCQLNVFFHLLLLLQDSTVNKNR